MKYVEEYRDPELDNHIIPHLSLRDISQRYLLDDPSEVHAPLLFDVINAADTLNLSRNS